MRKLERKIDLNSKPEIIEYISNKGKVYELKVGNINVEMSYSESDKKIDECMLNILKQKKREVKYWLEENQNIL